MTQSSALLTYLQKCSPLLAGKAEELRGVMTGWLSYVPHTFPHYTRHTIEHSERIIAQLSKILFHDDDPGKPVLKLSGAEAYILAAGAILHDSGMVASDSEKIRILQSDEWQEWTQKLGGRLDSIEALRSASEPKESTTRNFLADVQLRFLLSDFIRARHHRRSGDFLTQHQLPLGRFALDDLSLLRTIEDVCVGHGLDRSELVDEYRFPFQRDVIGEKVNVRLMAILLRLSDLLDMDSDRACPLLLTAACPIPSNSLAHWTQYRRIPHRNTSPEVVEIFAECETHQEHRLLLDWCTWICEELQGSRALLSGSRRHGSWVPPRASIGAAGSIRINPSKNASYVPSNWQITLDSDAVLDRLINDTYSNPLAFVRELIQNAIDTTRCQLRADGVRVDDSDTATFNSIPLDIGQRYAVHVRLHEEMVRNELTGQDEAVHVVTVEDRGVGMGLDVIERYFLQIGRSYYQTPEFRQRYGFPAIGRYGIGFLSVFAVSEYVTVDTRTDGRFGEVESTRLVLTGPKNYLLRERSTKSERGTCITVRLRQKLDPDKFRDFVRNLCRRVEFPIELIVGSPETILHETADAFTSTTVHIEDPAIQFVVKAYPFSFERIRGEFYMFEVMRNGALSWADWAWANYSYGSSHPLAQLPALPEVSWCENGLDYNDDGRGYNARPFSLRVDSRGPARGLALDRQSRHGSSRAWKDVFADVPELESFARQWLTSHLAQWRDRADEDHWVYMQKLVEHFDLPQFWTTYEKGVRHCRDGRLIYSSLADLDRCSTLVTVHSVYWSRFGSTVSHKRVEGLFEDERCVCALTSGVTLSSEDMTTLSDFFRSRIFQERVPAATAFLKEHGVVCITWQMTPDRAWQKRFSPSGAELLFLACSELQVAAFWCPHSLGGRLSNALVVNTAHPFGGWCSRVHRACYDNVANLKRGSFASCIEHFQRCIGAPHYIDSINEYLSSWRRIPALPDDLIPPELSYDDVTMVPPAAYESLRESE